MAEALSGSRLRGVAHGGPLRGLRGPVNAGSLAPPCPPPLRFAIFPAGPGSGMGADFSYAPLARAQAFRVGETGDYWGSRAAPQPMLGHTAIFPRDLVRMEQPKGRLNLHLCSSPPLILQGSAHPSCSTKTP